MTAFHRVRLVDSSSPWLLWSLLGFALLLPFLDAFLGPDLRLSILTTVPVALIAWLGRRELALSLALLLPLERMGLELFVWQNDPISVSALNGAIRMVVLIGITLLVYTLGKRMRELRTRFTTFLDASEDAIIGTDQNGIVEIWNTGAERVFGYPAAEIIGRSVTVLSGPEQNEEMAHLMERLRRGERIASYETVRLRNDGTPVEISASFFPLRSSTGIIVGMAATIRDITARRRAEADQRALTQLLRSIGEHFPHSYISVINRDMTVGFTTGQAFKLRNLDPADFVGLSIEDVFGSYGTTVLNTVAEKYRQAFAGTPQSFELVLNDEYQSYDIVPLIDDTGNIYQILSVVQDVTERRRAEQALRESERRYAALFANAPIPAALATYPDAIIVDANAAVERLTGFSKQELVGKTALELGIISAEEQQHVLVAMADPGKTANREMRIRIKSGEERIVAMTGSVLQIDGQIYMISTPFDITERTLATERLRQSEERFSTLFHQSPIALALGSYPNGTFAQVNDTFCQLFALTREQALGRSAAELGILDTETRSWLYELLRRDGEMRNQEVVAFRANGEPLYIVSSVCFVTIDGATYSLISMLDITERKRAEQMLKGSEERLRLAQQAAHIGAFDFDFRTGENYWTPELEALHGLPPGSFDGTAAAWQALVHPEDLPSVMQHVDQAHQTSEPINTEWRVIWPDGTIRWLAGRFQVIINADGTMKRLVGVNMDITKRKQAEAERRAFEAKLHQTQRLESLGVLAGGIAHDFNNLLTIILGHADLVAQQVTPDSPAYESITAAITAAHRAAELIAQMLAYAGKSSFVVTPLDLSKLVADLRPLLTTAVAKNCLLDYRLKPTMPPVAADATQLRQVIMNLVINASEAMEERGGTITLTTSVKRYDRAVLAATYLDDALPEGVYVSLTVADQGSGMTQETQARMFEPFFTTKFTGRGLGLAAVLGMVRGHGGALAVQSTVDVGTTVTVLLPATTAPAITTQNERAELPWRGSGTVLVVDDEAGVRAMVRLMLEQMGFTVLTAVDGRDGVDVFSRTAHLRLVLLDMTMPHMDGAQALRAMQALRTDVPVIIMSGYSEVQVRSMFAEQQPTAFVQKPFALGAVRALLRRILDG